MVVEVRIMRAMDNEKHEKLQLEDELEENNQDNLPEITVDEINDDDLEQHSETSETYTKLLANIDTKNLEVNTGDIDMDEKPSTSGITYHDKATQTETEEEDTIEKILKAITTLCTKVDSMDNEIQKLKTNEDNLKSKGSQQHDYKNAELCRSKDGKSPELKGDDGKLLKTHNVIKIGLTKDMIIPEDIGQQEEICKIEIPSFYANKRIIGISTIIQELANNYLNGNAIWSYYSRHQLMIYSNSRELRRADMDEVQRWILSLLKLEERPTTRALKEGFISTELLIGYCKLIGHKYPDHICSKCNGEDHIISDVHLE
ncbi:hypothetical protein H5410_036910 [Solanum commersonii]|uniref:Uncharacterized protein n=1 Tax=Solanum commersonii TaxID=4109 RepID=A0A9J5Y9L2_SOLCO|nr:hypothetical protein H5410_036910 [Solanum commersonii]